MFFILCCIYELPGNLVKIEISRCDGAWDCIPKFPENADTTGPQSELVLKPGGDVVFKALRRSQKRKTPKDALAGLPLAKHNILWQLWEPQNPAFPWPAHWSKTCSAYELFLKPHAPLTYPAPRPGLQIFTHLLLQQLLQVKKAEIFSTNFSVLLTEY